MLAAAERSLSYDERLVEAARALWFTIYVIN
jgi:hypothetical protein